MSGYTGAGQRGTACTRTKTLKARMNTQLQPTHAHKHTAPLTQNTKTNVKEGECGKMREQLASRRGIREQKRICWRAKPAATAESLYKQPVKPSAQVGTISPQTISRRSVDLPGAAAQAKLGCGFSVINSETETHDGRRETLRTNTDAGMNVSTSACKQTDRFTLTHAQAYSIYAHASDNHTVIQVNNFTHHGVTNGSVCLSRKLVAIETECNLHTTHSLLQILQLR